MDSNTYSTDQSASQPPDRPAAGPPDELADLVAVLDRLAARNLDRLSDAVRAERVLVLRRLADRLDGLWLKELAGSMLAGLPGRSRTGRSGRPPDGSGPSCAWAPARPAPPCGPPGPCSAAPWPRPPKP